jgi:hypothetical protein
MCVFAVFLKVRGHVPFFFLHMRSHASRMMATMLSIKRRVLQGARLPAGLLWQWTWSPCLFAFCLLPGFCWLPGCVAGHIRFVDVFSESGKPLVSWKHGKTARFPRSTLK